MRKTLKMKTGEAAIIHPTAVVHKGAQLGEGVEIGPYCVVGSKVQLGARVKLHSHVVIEGNTEIGEGTELFPFASIGHVTQDKKFHGEDSRLVIGRNNVIREYVTMQGGTSGGRLETRIGDDGWFMACTHVAHDCVLGNKVTMSNHATLAGHVTVGDNVVFGGLSAVHQFVRIGRNAIIGGMTGVANDVIPYGMVMSDRGYLSGINLIGLQRGGFARAEIASIQSAFKTIFSSREGTLAERVEKASLEFADDQNVKEIIDFMTADSNRSFCLPKTA